MADFLVDDYVSMGQTLEIRAVTVVTVGALSNKVMKYLDPEENEDEVSTTDYDGFTLSGELTPEILDKEGYWTVWFEAETVAGKLLIWSPIRFYVNRAGRRPN